MSGGAKIVHAAGVVALLLACSPSSVAEQALPAASAKSPAPAQDDLRLRAAQALARDPRALKSAQEGRWAKWGPTDPVAPELKRDLVAGMRAYAAQDYAASLAFFHGLLDREAEFPPALYQGGLCYFRLRRYGDAALMFERFARVAPGEIGATQALGHCYYSLGEFERARAHYERVLPLAQKSPEALRGLALSEMRLGNTARALELLAKVVELRPDHADAQAWWAQILFDEGDIAGALAHAERSRDLAPWEPRGWFLLSRIYAELGRDEEAEKSAEKFGVASRIEQQVRQQEGLLLHDPGRTEVWAQLIALQRSRDNRAAVREAVARLAALPPPDIRTALVVVLTFEFLGEEPRAIEAAKVAEAMAGSDKATWNWLADFYRRVGDVKAAERASKAAAKN